MTSTSRHASRRVHAKKNGVIVHNRKSAFNQKQLARGAQGKKQKHIHSRTKVHFVEPAEESYLYKYNTQTEKEKIVRTVLGYLKWKIAEDTGNAYRNALIMIDSEAPRYDEIVIEESTKNKQRLLNEIGKLGLYKRKANFAICHDDKLMKHMAKTIVDKSSNRLELMKLCDDI